MEPKIVNKQLSPIIDILNSKKCKRTFKRHHQDKYVKLGKKWRKPHGIDNRVRRQDGGAIKKPGKRYMTDARIKHLNPTGFREVLVENVKDLEPLKMNNQHYAAVIRHAVGAKKRAMIVQAAEEFDIVVLNGSARLVEEIDEEN